MKKFREISEASKMKGKDPCWKGYEMVGTKEKNGKTVPNCVPEETEIKEGNGYDDNRRGFGKPPREDDEYHVPDPTVKKMKMKMAKEETDTSEKNEMAQTQLHFIKYAAEEILEYIEMGGEIEEWYQNKLSKVQSEVESLHSYVEGESRRTGMKEDVEQLEEGRPSQRHPLEGHEYHKKTNAELEYIAKDAHKAAEAMKSHNTTAENKYRDQANDSATVRYFRKKNGMPEWYKKKYGHVNEATKDDSPPFDPDPPKKHPVAKAGKHGQGYSTARHLARMAMDKVASNYKKPLKEDEEMSNKARIVKDAVKGKKNKKATDEKKDTFQAEPILSKSQTRNY